MDRCRRALSPREPDAERWPKPASVRARELTLRPALSVDEPGKILADVQRSQRWQAFGSYTLSKASGPQPSSGTTAAGAQVSTIAPPPAVGITFGRDPNDLTNAPGRLPNDRPHMLRVMTSVDVPRTAFVVAANMQHFSGKPWAATAQVSVPQNTQQRVLFEPRGSRRLPSQTLLGLRLSRTFSFRRFGRIDVLVDVLNLLDDTAAEDLVTDNLFSPSFAQPAVFMDPRRVMVGVRMNVGQ
jgi:hypothetical protein